MRDNDNTTCTTWQGSEMFGEIVLNRLTPEDAPQRWWMNTDTLAAQHVPGDCWCED